MRYVVVGHADDFILDLVPKCLELLKDRLKILLVEFGQALDILANPDFRLNLANRRNVGGESVPCIVLALALAATAERLTGRTTENDIRLRVLRLFGEHFVPTLGLEIGPISLTTLRLHFVANRLHARTLETKRQSAASGKQIYREIRPLLRKLERFIQKRNPAPFGMRGIEEGKLCRFLAHGAEL